jgi:hypothetical protein
VSTSRHPLLLAGIVLCATLSLLAASPAASQAAACDPPVTNPVACENTLPGADPTTWEVSGAGDATIQGFATSMSVNKGGTISFKIKSATPNYHIDILRLGYYGGDGARLIASNLTPTSTAAQPACQTFADTGLIDCGNWSVSRTWAVPGTAVSGVYVAHLVRNDTGGDSQITFVVRDDSSTADVMVQTSDATWEAYNTYGGNSLYSCTVACPPGNPKGYKAAFKVSYNRPFTTADDSSTSWLSNAELAMIRFLERMGYNATYASQVDTETSPALIRNHKVFISSGHDEYWSKNQRNNVTAARDAGVNLAFFSGNEVFWKTRYENANRTLVAYKDTHFDAATDPVEWTGTWQDPRFASDTVPQNDLTGQSFIVNEGTSEIMVPAQFKNLRMWRNTAVTSLASGQSLRLGTATLGYEWDEDPDNGYRPPGQFRLSSTTVTGLQTFLDYGSTVQNSGTATHNLTTYRAPGGGLVFGAGTVQWSWGLDDENPLQTTPDRNMQQATVNLFADMGAQPANLIPNVVGATKSTDTTKPTSTINSPPASVADGSVVTITGTASDTGGGVVAGVEISTDNGSTWHPVTSGTTSWSYTWTAHGVPAATIKTRAVDDSANLEVPSAGRTVTVTCPCSIWGTSFPVPDPDAGDASPIEVGMKFTTEKYGMVSGLRFYKGAANTGTHVGSLWSATGTRLAQATFTSETASGWQTVTFSQPVQVLPNTTYVASYFAPNGHYAGTQSYMYKNPAPAPQGGGTQDSSPLHVVRDSGTTHNGVYTYGSQSTFPNNSFGASNYWVDVLFTPTAAPGQAANVTATAGGKTSANVSWSAPATGGAPTSYIVTPYVGASAQTPTTVSGLPPATSAKVSGLTNGTTYTFKVTASNPTGDGPQSTASGAVTPLNAVAPSAPTGVMATGGTTAARITWTASDSDGDSALTGYTITPYIGASAQTPVTVGPSTTTTTVGDLTNGTAYTFAVKATNGVGSSPASSPSVAVTPQSTIFDFATPATADGNDTDAVELGMKFTSDISGSVTGVRFYKSAANAGTHTGSLWTSTGTRLAQATFTSETATGWQIATFATPVNITAGTTYVVSYYAPLGHYAASGFGNATVDNGPLHSMNNNVSSNGVYAYGLASSFPNKSYNASNYWVDILFAVPAPGQPTGVSAAAAGKSSATVSWTAPSTGGTPDRYVVTAYAGTDPQVTKTVTGTPLPASTTVTGLTTGTAYTFKVAARNINGSGPESAASNAVTPLTDLAPAAPTNVNAAPATSSARVSWTAPGSDGGTPVTGYTITPFVGATAQPSTTAAASATSATVTGLTNGTAYTFKVKATNAVGDSPQSAASNSATPGFTLFELATPATSNSGDPSSINLGVRFRADSSGQVRGIRFYKDALNTGTHVGSLWNAGGTLLAQATFTSESASGWQSVTFAAPVDVTAGATYVASYLAPAGHYSSTANQFGGGAVDNPPLHAAGPSNGVYAYGAASAFPNSSFNATNYWVDVLYTNPPPPNPPSNVTATAGGESATVSWTAPASGSAPTGYTIQARVAGSPAGAPKTITGTPPATSTTMTGLTGGTTYTFTVTATNADGSSTASAPSNPVTPTTASPPTVPTGVAAQGDSRSAIVRWTAPGSDGGSQITSYTVTPFIGAAAQPATSVGGSATSAVVAGLTNGTSYTFKVSAANGAGTSPASDATTAVVPRTSIFELGTPATIDAGDAGAVNLGVKFRSDVAGSVTGVRFYKATANTGTHVGSLWSATGTLLAQGTFTGETASGWQALTFSSQVAIDANTVYVVSYLAPKGHYSVTGGGFGLGSVDNAPLHGLADSISSNGVYAYGAAPAFPVNSFNAGNYWVDLLLAPGP